MKTQEKICRLNAIDECKGFNKRKVILLKNGLTREITDKMNDLTYDSDSNDIICDFDYDLLTLEEYIYFSQFDNVTITKQNR